MRRLMTMFILVSALVPAKAHAVIAQYTNRQAWEQAVGAHTRITFQEVPPQTWVSDQYAHLGVTFELNANVGSQIQSQLYYLNDSVGLASFGVVTSPVVYFTNPTYAIAVDTPLTFAFFEVYYQGSLVGDATVGGGNYFKGIVSTQPFDAVYFMPQLIDDLYFAPPILAPAGLALLAVAAGTGRSRRRR